MPLILQTGHMARDAGSRYTAGPWDTSANRGLGFRAFNVDGTNGVGDAGVVLVDASGNPLMVASAALADGMANPTTSRVGAHPLVFTGTNWDRVRAQPSGADLGASGGVQAVHATIADSTVGFAREWSAATAADGALGRNNAAVMPMLFNGATWERQRNNTTLNALSSAARTATTASSNITNYNARGCIFWLDITATPNNAETVSLQLQAMDPVTTKFVTMTFFTAIVASSIGATSTTATFMYTTYPGAAETVAVTNHEVHAMPVPRTFRVLMSHSGGGSWTYSVGYNLMV